MLSHRLFLPKQFTVGFSPRRKKAGRDMLWPRSRSLSAMCPPLSALCPPGFPTLCHAFALCSPCVRRVSASCPPCVRLECAWPRLQTLSASCLPRVFAPCVFICHVAAIACSFCQPRSTMIMCLRLWTFSACGLLWGQGPGIMK